MTKFRDLTLGQTFDFVNPAKPNSFSARCRKISPRGYELAAPPNTRYNVGTIDVEVHHVEVPEVVEAAAALAGYHQFMSDNDQLYGSFLVYEYIGGWFWIAQQPGCLPDTDDEPAGPFSTSKMAYLDAMDSAAAFFE